jgi:glycosyltransferase involved in cell wall biosynthesis
LWKAIIDLLNDHPETYYLAMGVEESQIPFISSMLSPAIRPQIRFTGWRGSDYLSTLCLADIYLDTFPSGGGGVLVDAMALGIPVVSFKNDYMKLYDQTDWSPAEELYNVNELIVSRGDFAEMKRLVSRLIDDQKYRRDLAQRCQTYILETRGDPARGVRKCEDLYLRILEQRFDGTVSLDPREAEIEEITRVKASETRPSRLAWTAYQMKRVLRLGERMLDRLAERKG